MANVYGPKIIRNGLVLYLDKYNERSYLGEPTVNLLTSQTNMANWTETPWVAWGWGSGYAGTVTVDQDGDSRTPEDVATVALYCGTPNVWVEYAQLTNLAVSTTYTISYWHRANPTGTYGNTMYVYALTDGVSVLSQNVTCSDTWVRHTAQFTTRSTTQDYRIASYNYTAGMTLYINGIQVEEKSSYSTKFVEGTRSATDGWQDLTGNGNHADLTTLTYTATNVPGANTNDFSFDGVDDYNSLGSDITIKSTGEWTQESWVKADTVAGGPFNFAGHQNPDTVGWYWSILNSKLAIWNKSPGAWLYGGTTLSTGAWYQCVCVSENVDGTSYKFYLNGVNDGGTVESYTFNGSGDYKKFIVQDIGRSSATYSRYFDGQIDMSKFYNRSLTATEVLQNFNAHKGRYGL